jgi:hypothetical protein
MTTKTTEKTLPALAAERAAAIQDADWIRAGGRKYVAAIKADLAAASGRLADRRLLAADGETLPGLRAAVGEVNDTIAQLADEGKRESKLDVLLRDTRGTFASAIAQLTDRLEHDAEIVRRVAEPSLSELKTWSPSSFLRAQLDTLAVIKGVEGIREVLTDYWPQQRAEILRRLTTTIPPAPEPGRARSAGAARPLRQDDWRSSVTPEDIASLEPPASASATMTPRLRRLARLETRR